MGSGNALGVPGSMKGPPGLVVAPGSVLFCSHSQLHLCGQELGRERALTRVVLYPGEQERKRPGRGDQDVYRE